MTLAMLMRAKKEDLVEGVNKQRKEDIVEGSMLYIGRRISGG